jgi:hypothetical protein
MKSIFLAITTYCLIATSCVNNPPKEKDLKSTCIIDLDTSVFLPSVYDLFSNIEIIPLETNKESILIYSGSLKHQVYKEKHYFLSPKQNKLFVFDRQGNFVKTIDKTGNGPGEYTMIYDFEISRFDDKLNLMTPYGKVLIYDSDGEKYIESFNLPDSIRAVHQFKILSKDIYVFSSSSEKCDLYFYSKPENSIKKSLVTMPNFLFSTPFNYGRTPFYYYKDSLRYFMGYDGTVFNIDPSNFDLGKRYYLDFGKQSFKLSDLPVNETPMYYFEYSKNMSDKIVSSFARYFETHKYLISWFRYRNNVYHLFFNKINNRPLVVRKLKEDVELNFTFFEKDTIYGIVPVEFAHLYVNDKIVTQENFNTYKSLPEESNLLLIKYSLK